MRYVEVLETEALKPRSKSPKSFTVANNLVVVMDYAHDCKAYNGDPRNGGLLIGVSGIWKDGDDYSVINVGVKKPYQRKGVARAMYDKCEEYAQAKGGKLVPAISVSDDAFHFWNAWKPERIAYDGRHWDQHYLGKTVRYKDQDWIIRHTAHNTPQGGFQIELPDGSVSSRVPKKLVTDQLGDYYPAEK